MNNSNPAPQREDELYLAANAIKATVEILKLPPKRAEIARLIRAVDECRIPSPTEPREDGPLTMTREREKLIREGFCFDSDRDCIVARELLAEITALRERIPSPTERAPQEKCECGCNYPDHFVERAPAWEAPPLPTSERLREIADYLLMDDLEETQMALDIRAVADWMERQQREGNHG